MRRGILFVLVLAACGPERSGHLGRLGDATLSVTAVFDGDDRLSELVVALDTPPGRCPVLSEELEVTVDGLRLDLVDPGGVDPEDPFGRTCIFPRVAHTADGGVDLVSADVARIELSDATDAWVVEVEGLRQIAWDELPEPLPAEDDRVPVGVGDTLRVQHHPASDDECLASDWCQHTALFLAEDDEAFVQQPLYDVVDGVAVVEIPEMAAGPYQLLVTGFVPRVLTCDGPAICRATRAGGVPDLIGLRVEASPQAR